MRSEQTLEQPSVQVANTGRYMVIDGELSGKLSVVKSDTCKALDPHKMAIEYPIRWKIYCREHYDYHTDLIPVFQIDEKTARNWWDGKGSPRSDKTSIAVNRHPETAPKILFDQSFAIAAE